MESSRAPSVTGQLDVVSGINRIVIPEMTAENLLAGRPARISSTIPLALRERIGSPQDRGA